MCYTDFDLLRISSGGSTRRWRVGARGPGVIACDESQAPLVGRYGVECRRPAGTSVRTRLTDPQPLHLRFEGTSFEPGVLRGRGPALHAAREPTWFVGELKDTTGEGQPLTSATSPRRGRDHAAHRDTSFPKPVGDRRRALLAQRIERRPRSLTAWALWPPSWDPERNVSGLALYPGAPGAALRRDSIGCPRRTRPRTSLRPASSLPLSWPAPAPARDGQDP